MQFVAFSLSFNLFFLQMGDAGAMNFSRSTLSKLCGDQQRGMFGTSYNFQIRKNVSLGFLCHQLRSTSIRGNMKLVCMMPGKLLKALRMMLERVKLQVGYNCSTLTMCWLVNL